MSAPAPPLDTDRLAVLLMAGGSGTRLWPLSRPGRAKQFAPLAFPRTLLEETYARAVRLAPDARIFVNVTRGSAHWARRLLPSVPATNVIEAPDDRDTLATLGFAALAIERVLPSPTLVLLASDNWIEDPVSLDATLRSAAAHAQAGPSLVSVGIRPTHASTQYGYMRLGARLDDHAFVGAGYREKPDARQAAELFATGTHDWNSGMFAWDAGTFWAAVRAFAPEDAHLFERMREHWDDIEQRDAAFRRLRKIAVDHAVMERVDDGAPVHHVFVRATTGWDDIGHYEALSRYLTDDGRGNRVHGDVDVVDSTDCVVFAGAGCTARVSGVTGLIIAVDGGDILVAARGSSGKVRELREHPAALLRGELDRAQNRARGLFKAVGSSRCIVDSSSAGVMALLDVHDLHVSASSTEVRVQPKTPASSVRPDGAPSPRILVSDEGSSLGLLAARLVVDRIKAAVAARGSATVSLSAGHTPIATYEFLRSHHSNGELWRRVTLVQMDEYAGVPPDDARSFHSFLRRTLVEPLGIDSFRGLSGHASHADLADHEAWVSSRGLDLVLHGIGENGHLALNEPGPLDAPARRVNLAPSTLAPVVAAFGSVGAPRQGLTLGLPVLNRARSVILLALGPAKATAVARAFGSSVSAEVPASSLLGHADVTILLDRDAAASIARLATSAWS